MEIQQNPTKPKIDLPSVQQEVDPRYQLLIDYKALNGLMTDQEGNMRKMPMQELADALKVDRTTLYEWMKRDGFWDEVNERRKDISPKSRLSRVHETWFLKAAAGEFQHMQLWLANFDPNFRMPTEKVEHEMGDSWAAMLSSRRQSKAIEGEVINGDDTNKTLN